jgi:hypothetical protein
MDVISMAGKLTLLGILVICGGLISLALGYMTHRQDAVLRKWPVVRGQVLSAQIVKTTQARLVLPARSTGSAPDPTYRKDLVWALAVEYQYTVEEKMFTGYRSTSSLLVEDIRMGILEPSEKLRALCSQILVEKERPVHYDPINPRESYLLYVDNPRKAQMHGTGWICVVIGLAMIAAAKFVLE